MSAISHRKRAGRPLLVAAIGVATVSYVGTQSGCADTATPEDEQSTAPYDDEPALGVSQQGLSIATSAAQAAQRSAANGALRGDITIKPDKVFPPSGNLMPPPGDGPVVGPVGGGVFEPIPFPPGNLMAPPIEELELELEFETK